MFPLDPGRQYHVTFAPPGAAPLTATVGLPATHTTPTTVVAQVFPSGEVIPENQLRLYIHFSAPMGMKGGLDYVHLLDEQGKEVIDPFLPLDAEFWNDDRTRYTVFFDPGRQKRGIPVDRRDGPIADRRQVLHAGRRQGVARRQRPTAEGNLQAHVQGRPARRAAARSHGVADPGAAVRHARAAASSRFPSRSIMACCCARSACRAPTARAIGGDISVGTGELTWSFTPREFWKAGTHHLVAFGMLEDLAGNRIGRAFEVDQFDRSDKSASRRKR